MSRRSERSEESRKRDRSVSSGRKEEGLLQASKRSRDESSGRSTSRDVSVKSREVTESRGETESRGRSERSDRSHNQSKREASPKRDGDHPTSRELREQREAKEREEAIARREQRRKEREEQKAREAPSALVPTPAPAKVDAFGRERDEKYSEAERQREKDREREKEAERRRERDRRDRDRSREREMIRRERRDPSPSSFHRRRNSRERSREHERSSSTSHRNIPTLVSSKLEQLKNDWQAELLEDDLLGNLQPTSSATQDHHTHSSSAKYISTLMKFLSPRLAGSVLYDQLQAMYGTSNYAEIAAASAITTTHSMQDAAAVYDPSSVKMEPIDASAAAVEDVLDTVHTAPIVFEAKDEPDLAAAAAVELEEAALPEPDQEPVLMSIAEEKEEPPSFLLGLDDDLGGDFDLYGDLSTDVGGGGDMESEEVKDTAIVFDNVVAESKAETVQPAVDLSTVKQEADIAGQDQAAYEEVFTQKLFLLPRDESTSSSMLLSDLSINRLSLLCRAARGQNPASTLLQEASALKALFH